jgi:hypothetical protein
MSRIQPKKEAGKLDKVLDQARRERELRDVAYRERALKLFPWVCGRCGREFSGRRLKELTVHHKDHNHENNPSDGSNWELLCIYCHDMEHQKYVEEDGDDAAGQGRDRDRSSLHKPFAGLADLLKEKKS